MFDRLVPHWQYLKYVIRHKIYVWQAGRMLGVSPITLLMHDMSKFLPSEWFPYVNYFYAGSKYSDKSAFDRAWLLHQKRNKHHWQYWILREDNGNTIALDMTEKYVKEMIADWYGAGMAINGSEDVKKWYRENYNKVLVSANTLCDIAYILSMSNFVKLEYYGD